MGEVIYLQEAGRGSLAGLEKRVDYLSSLVAKQHIAIRAMDQRSLSTRRAKANLRYLAGELSLAVEELFQRETQARLSAGNVPWPAMSEEAQAKIREARALATKAWLGS